MTLKHLMIPTAFIIALGLATAPAEAQRRGGRGGGHVASVGGARIAPRGIAGHAVPRPVLGSRRPFGPAFYGYPRSFFYGPRFTLGLGFGYGYGYPYGYWGPYAYPYGYYGSYGYPYYPYGAPVGYGYGGYGYADYGGVRLDMPQKDAAVYVDGYYAGIVDDFDGTFQRLELTPGAHRIEVKAPGFVPLAFDVNADTGRTIHYRASLIPAQP